MMTAALTMIDPNAAPLFGAAGLAVRMAAPLFARRGTILTAQLAASCLYASSYALMQQQTATAVCLIGAAQTTLALVAGERPWLNRTGYAFLPIALVIGLFTFSGLATLLAVTACCLTMIGRLQCDLIRMRATQLCASPFNAAHDIVIGAWPCLLGGLLTFAVAAAALRRELKRRRAA